MAVPPEDEAPEEEAPPGPARPEVHLVEASEARERTCAECGKKTVAWKPARRQGMSVILCLDCAAKPPPEEGGCPTCGAPLEPHDAFCGKCGTRIEYVCPQCGAVLDAEDAFCGKCGARVT